jgi:hypothetical protein
VNDSSRYDSTATIPAARWRQVFEILDHALELTPEERAAYVERACAGNTNLGADVAALLAGAESPSFLKSPAAEFAAHARRLGLCRRLRPSVPTSATYCPRSTPRTLST